MIILIVISAIFFLQFLPWWGIVIFGGFVGFYYNKLYTVLLFGFLLGASSWGIPFIYHYLNDGKIIVERISNMLQLDYSIILLLVTVVLAGIISTISSLCCFYFKKIL